MHMHAGKDAADFLRGHGQAALLYQYDKLGSMNIDVAIEEMLEVSPSLAACVPECHRQSGRAPGSTATYGTCDKLHFAGHV